MARFGNDSVSVNVEPVIFEELGEVNFTDMNMLFYYEVRST